MITKLIALLTLLFAPLHISNNIFKDGVVERDKVSLSRPQLNNSLEPKRARDYNEYFGNNSFKLLNSGTPLEDVKTLLGHTKLDTTMIYCNIDKENIKHFHRIYL